MLLFLWHNEIRECPGNARVGSVLEPELLNTVENVRNFRKTVTLNETVNEPAHLLVGHLIVDEWIVRREYRVK